MTTPDELVTRIAAFNDVWHALRDLWPDDDPDEPLLAELRDVKGMLQAALLRHNESPAYLRYDRETALSEPCFSVALHRPLAGRRDACHLPERVARAVLSEAEICHFLERPHEP